MNLNKFVFLIFTLFTFFFFKSFAQSGAEYFIEQGNLAYRNGDYEKSLEWYQKILDTGYESGTVYYNMGNCCYKLDKIGFAVLYYEKAIKLMPGDSEIKFNLDLTNLKVLDRVDLLPRFLLFNWWDAVKYFFSLRELTYLVIIVYVIISITLIIYFFIKTEHFRRIVFSLFIVSLALLLFWTFILILNIKDTKNIEAVVVSKVVIVESAPEESSTNVFILHEGIKVKLTDQRGEWAKIELRDGKSGWMKFTNIRVI